MPSQDATFACAAETQRCIVGRGSLCLNLITCIFFPPLIASLLAGLPFAILNVQHSPFRRGFFCNDDSIKYPYKEDTISYQLLGGVMIPITILTVSASVLLFTNGCSLLPSLFFFMRCLPWRPSSLFYSPLLPLNVNCLPPLTVGLVANCMF